MTPGSPEAVKAGCSCSAFDNRMGKGAYNDADGQPLFWYSQYCKLHGDPHQVAMDNMYFDHPSH
jgi:hypothetical protein